MENHAPVLATAPSDQQVTETEAFSFTIPAATFSDPDGNALTLSVKLSSGAALPSWLAFDAATRTLSGTPPDTAAGQLAIQIKATDTEGAFVTAGFSLDIANIINGTAAGNSLVGIAGRDVMYGFAGNDTYVVNDVGDMVVELAGEGTDTVQSSVTYTLTDNVERLTLTGTAAINGTGNGLNNVLTGNVASNTLTGGIGNDTLNGGLGADTLAGGAGNDTYVVDNAGDVVVELVGEGTDTVQSSVSYVLTDNVENLTLTGTAAINGTGNGLNNVLTGNVASNVLTGGIGNDSINGGAGADTLIGGLGNDTYTVDNAADVVIELVGEGTDKIQSSVSYTLSDNVENLTLTGTAVITGTGNALANVLTGNAAGSTLYGLDGNDTLIGGTGADTLVGGAGNDIYTVDNAGDVVIEAAGEGTDIVNASVSYTLASDLENLTLTGTAAINGTGNALANTLLGNAAANTLSGGDGNDVLNGGAGADTQIGGMGDDSYIVDNVGDTLVENFAEGTDTVSASVSYTLSSNLENLTLTGSTAINATGNELDNVLIGNSGANTLTGGAGNDTLNGGGGSDTMLGGAGDDLYYVNVATDIVTESADEGLDTVNSSVSYTLIANVENLNLTGTGSLAGTGNDLSNRLTGNTGGNTLNGGAGDDYLDGKAGNDTLIGGTGNDTYFLGRGYGSDAIQENDASAGNLDIAQFDTGIATDQLWFRKVSNNLEVSVIGTLDKFTISNWYLGSQYHVEQFKTSDGAILLDNQVQNLVQAMAAFAPPAAGQTTLNASQQAALAPLISANWH